MLEYEVKVPISNADEVRKRIAELGGKLVEKRLETDYYIDIRTCSNVPGDVVIRVRRISLGNGKEKGELTYKGRRFYDDVKAREEITVEVSDPSKVVEIFRKLGFKIIKVEKTREIFLVDDDIKICMDNVVGLGKFIEIEVINPSSKEYFMNKVNKVLKGLSLQKEEVIVKSYLEMLLGD